MTTTQQPRDPGSRNAAPLRVALVLDDSLDRDDGVQQSVLTLGAWLTEQGHEVAYVASNTHRTDLANVHNLARSLPVRFNQNTLRVPFVADARGIEQLLASHDFDVVHVQMPYSPFLAGRVISRLRERTALVGTFHILPAGASVTLGLRALRLVQRRQLRRYGKVVAVSPPAGDYVEENLRIPAVVVPNPVPVERFLAHEPAPRPASSGPVGSASAPARIVFLGRLVPRKGAHLLLEAVAELEAREEDLHVHVTIVGDGPQRDSLERRAAQLRSAVEFTGHVGEGDKPGIFAGADVVVLPSTGGESFGIVLVEALACATGTVIAGDNPGYRSVMGPLTEQVVDANETTSLARAITAAVRDEAGRTARVEAQRGRALEFDISQVGPRVEQVYREALAQRPRAAAPTRG